jgi:transcription antitermination factor NusG
MTCNMMANADPGGEMTNPGARWYAVSTRSHFEPSVAADLGAKGIENYLPAVREVHQWKDRKKAVDVPLFPGYVFARFMDTDQARLMVLRVRGAVRILGQENAIEPIPDAQIDNVRQLLQSQRHFAVHPFLREGALVRVTAGPLKGVEGLLVRVKNENRLVLSVDALSQSVSTEIDINAVELLRPAPSAERQVA